MQIAVKQVHVKDSSNFKSIWEFLVFFPIEDDPVLKYKLYQLPTSENGILKGSFHHAYPASLLTKQIFRLQVRINM